jgi:serine/threonine-protein kinase
VLRDAVNAGPAAAVQALENLIKTQPDAFKEPTVQTAAAAALERIAEADLPETANVFDQLATSLGEPGLDVLYELATGPEESKAGVRARALLDKPDVFNRGSAAMRTAYDLRRASCQKRPFLFPRAAKEGDDRSLAILTSMLPPACEPRVSPCCFLKHGELERAMGEIRTRLRR